MISFVDMVCNEFYLRLRTDDNSETSSEDEIEMAKVSSTTQEELSYTQTKRGKKNIYDKRLKIIVV